MEMLPVGIIGNGSFLDRRQEIVTVAIAIVINSAATIPTIAPVDNFRFRCETANELVPYAGETMAVTSLAAPSHAHWLTEKFPRS